MSQSTLLKRLALASLVACLVSSCARNSEPHSHDEVTALKSELEQLANQVGRLEFRIYELENNNMSAQSTDGDPTAADDIDHRDESRSTAAPKTADGSYDLTPIDP